MLPFAKKALSNLFKKPSTVRFPEVEVLAQPNYRGRIVYDAEKCVNCGMCIKVCSPGAIVRTVEEAEGGENITYTIDLTSCTFCGTCQDFCNTKAITLSDDYHMVAENAADLRVTGTRFRKTVAGKVTLKASDCVYCGLCARNCPENAITVDRATKTWTLNEEECVKCGRCIEKCPKKALSFEEPKEEGVVMGEGCIYCTLCAKRCPVGAITVDRAAKTWEIDRDTCIKCGLCISNCPKKALSMGPVGDAPAAPAPAPEEKAAPETKAADEKVTLNASDCVYCGLCARSCPQGAISVDRATKTWTLNEEECVKCGLCISKCPRKALSMRPAGEAPAPAPEEKAVPAPAPAAEERKAGAPETAAPAAVRDELSGLFPASSYDWDYGIKAGADCVYCGLCARKCPMEAITVDRAEKSWKINREKCVWCGICAAGCPKKNLSLSALEPEKEAPAPVKAAPAEKPAARPAAATGVIFGEGCVYCCTCGDACPVGAISVDGDSWTIDRDACIQCGACTSACPMGALSLGELKTEEPAPKEAPVLKKPAKKAAPVRKGVVCGEGCVLCGTCAGACPVGALEVDGDAWSIDRSACIECGSCIGACPIGVLSMGEIETPEAPESKAAPAAEEAPAQAVKELAKPVKAESGIVCGDSCILCGACASVCPMGAITVDGGAWSIDRDACIQCEACVGTCPVGALSKGPIK